MSKSNVIDKDFSEQWLVEQARERKLPYLLAHADDGVIWGHFKENGQLTISGQGFADVHVPLRLETLQQLRLFGSDGEWLIWQTEEGFAGRYLSDDNAPKEVLPDEIYWLWGQAADPPGVQKGFTLMQDGRQGLRHAPPISLGRDQQAGLRVRHYLAEDEQGQMYIAFSRLVGLEMVKE